MKETSLGGEEEEKSESRSGEATTKIFSGAMAALVKGKTSMPGSPELNIGEGT